MGWGRDGMGRKEGIMGKGKHYTERERRKEERKEGMKERREERRKEGRREISVWLYIKKKQIIMASLSAVLNLLSCVSCVIFRL